MKTTIDVADALFLRAKAYARKTGRPFRALVEDGLRLVIEPSETPEPYRLPDRSVGSAKAADPLEGLSWQDLRDEIYGGR